MVKKKIYQSYWYLYPYRWGDFMKGLLTLKELSTEQIQGIITYAEELKHECRVSYNNKKFLVLLQFFHTN